MKMVRKAAVAFASLALAACGGGNNGNVAQSKNFSYGAAAAPTTAEQTAADTAQSTVSGTATFTATPDSTTATAIAGLGDSLAASALGATAVGAGAPPSLRTAMQTAVTTACASVTSTSVTFTNCVESDSGYNFTLNGWVTVAQGVVNWDVTGTFSGTNQGVSVNLTLHQHGNLTVTATTVKGSSLSEISGSVSASGQTETFALDGCANVDLTYDPTCVTSGTIEVKRAWAQLPAGASGPGFADVAVKLTWTGCNTVTVQHSV